MFRIIYSFYLLTLVTFPLDAQAYIGPGLGAGAVAVIIGLLASIFLAIVAVFWYPIKRLLKKKNLNTNKKTAPADVESGSGEE